MPVPLIDPKVFVADRADRADQADRAKQQKMAPKPTMDAASMGLAKNSEYSKTDILIEIMMIRDDICQILANSQFSTYLKLRDNLQEVWL